MDHFAGGSLDRITVVHYEPSNEEEREEMDTGSFADKIRYFSCAFGPRL